jgi:hypothetical protein
MLAVDVALAVAEGGDQVRVWQRKVGGKARLWYWKRGVSHSVLRGVLGQGNRRLFSGLRRGHFF